MREVPARQLPGEPFRRWFASSDFDLIVWWDAGGVPLGFQLCYDKGRRERAFTWRQATGLDHCAVDVGEQLVGLRHKATPMLAAPGALDAPAVAARFVAASGELPREVVSFVRDRLRH